MSKVKVQATRSHGIHKRYFWNVNLGDGLIMTAYRSRCATAAGVRAQFKKRGIKVVGVGKSTTV